MLAAHVDKGASLVCRIILLGYIVIDPFRGGGRATSAAPTVDVTKPVATEPIVESGEIAEHEPTDFSEPAQAGRQRLVGEFVERLSSYGRRD